jgi:hypothetical protein
MSGITHADAADGTFSGTGATNWAKDHVVNDLSFSGIFDGAKQTVACSHNSTAITITASVIECTTDGDSDQDLLVLPAGADGQMVFVHVKSCGNINDQFAISATFTDGSTLFTFGRHPKGKGAFLVYSTTATAGWAMVSLNDTVNNRSTNFSTADQSPAVTRTYITGSQLLAPPTGWKVGTMFRWTVFISKTAAGTTAPIFDLAFGTLGTTGDTARVTLTGAVTTALADTAMVTITGVVRGPVAAGSATTIVTGTMQIANNLSFTTGFKTQVINADSAGFDITAATSCGLCCTPGTSSAWTIHQVTAESLNT